MRNYIRYIVLLILIIVGGLLIISVINKVTEPDVKKVDNKNKTEEIIKEPTLDVDKQEENTPKTDEIKPNDNNQTANNSSTNTSNSNTNQEVPANNNVTVPNTKADSSVILTMIGMITLLGTVTLIRKNIKNI